eukprot:m.213109 g.213109  ORF g.213109 m.213109 type:complete len:528 (+) comp33140_c0_seq1:161-1744(+)
MITNNIVTRSLQHRSRAVVIKQLATRAHRRCRPCQPTKPARKDPILSATSMGVGTTASTTFIGLRTRGSGAWYSTSSSSTADLGAAVEQLRQMIVQSGGEIDVSAVAVSNSLEMGLGLSAARNITKGEVLVTLPPNAQLTYDDTVGNSTANDGQFSKLIQSIPQELWCAKLGLKLLVERSQGAKSTFYPYIRLLPNLFVGIPMFFGQTDVQHLQYAPVINQINRRGRFLYDFSQGPLSSKDHLELFDGHAVSINDFGWAFSSVSSRAFSVRGIGKPRSLLPMIDMANHGGVEDSNALVQISAGGVVTLKCKKSISPGDPILIDYGVRQTEEYLLDYGFLCKASELEAISVRWDLTMIDVAKGFAGVDLAIGSSGVADWQNVLLSKLNLIGDAVDLELIISADEAQLELGRLVVALRILFSEQPPATNINVDGNNDDNEGNNVVHEDIELRGFKVPLASVMLEEAVWKTSMGVCAFALASFPTTIEQDEEFLQQQGLSVNTLTAVRFRLGKKRLLKRIIEVHKKKLSL